MASTVDWRFWSMRLQSALPLLMLGMLALVTYWLVQNSPILQDPTEQAPKSAKPDAYFHEFKLVGLDENGQWQIQITGQRAWHREDLQAYEFEQPRMIQQDVKTGHLTRISAERARTNEDGTQVQLFGQAHIQREARVDARGRPQEALEIRSEYLMLDDRRQVLETHLPVTLKRGADEIRADRLRAMQLDGKLELEGRVRGTLAPRRNAQSASPGRSG